MSLTHKKYLLNTGNHIPSFGLGTWLAKGKDVYCAVREAINCGYRLIDCAARYGNEQDIGRALRDAFKNGDVKREDLFVSSKLWNDSHSPEDVLPAIESSIKNLGLDYLDLYLMHWPVAIRKGTNEPISLKDLPLDVTYRSMEQLHKKGLARAIGVANFSIKKLEFLKRTCNIIPAINQVEVNLYFQQPDLIQYCRNNGIVVTAAAPLSSQSRMVKPEGEKNPFEDSEVVRFAEKYGATKAQIMLSFLLSKELVVIPKSVNPVRIKENIGASCITLEAEDIKALEARNMNRRVFPGQGMQKGDYTYENLWDEDYIPEVQSK